MNSRKRSGQMRGRKPPFRPGNLPQNATVGGKPPFHTAPGFLVPQARVLIPPAEFTFWQKAYQKLLAETPIEQGAVTPFSSPVRLIELTTNINQVHMFHGHTYVEFEARRCNQNITIRIMFFFRGSILHVTAVEVYEPGKSYDTTQSLILLRSTITHANHSDCKIGQKADMSNSTFIKCCSGLDSCISFAHPLSLYEEQFIKTTWLHALEARDKLEAFEMPKDDKDHDGSDNKEGGIDPVGEKTLLTQIQSQIDETERLKGELKAAKEAADKAKEGLLLADNVQIEHLKTELEKSREIANSRAATEKDLLARVQTQTNEIEHLKTELKKSMETTDITKAALQSLVQTQLGEIARLETELKRTEAADVEIKKAKEIVDTANEALLLQVETQATEIERVETELKKAREIAYNAQYDLQAQQDATTQVERQLDEFKMAMDCLIGGMEKKGQEDRLTTKTTNPGESTNSKPADLSAKLRTMKNRLGSLESVSALSLSDSAKNTHMVECLSVENMKPQDEIARLKALEQNYFGQQHIEPYTTSATVKKDITPPFQNETTRLQQKNRPTAPMIGGSVRGGHPIYDFEKAESEPLNSVEKGSAEDQKRPSENGRTSHAVQNLQRRPLSLTKGDDAKDEGPKPKNNGAAAGNVKSTLFVENGLVDFTKEAGEDGQEDHEKRKPSDDLGDLYQPMESDLPNIHNEPGFGEVKVSEGGLLRNGNETRPHTRKLSGASSTKVVITGCESDDEEWGSYDALSQTRISSGDLGELAKVLALLSD